MAAYPWRVEIDLNQDNVWVDITQYVMDAQWKLGMSEPFQNMSDDATCTLKLKNDAGVFNPENASSPLYPSLLPGRRIRIIARRYTTSVTDGLIQYIIGDELTGTALNDSSVENNDAVATNVTLNATDSPIVGHRAGSFNGTPGAGASRVNLYSAGMASDFNSAEGSIVVWTKVSTADVWEDGATRSIIRLATTSANNNNAILIVKPVTNNTITCTYIAGGTVKSRTKSVSTADWFCVGLTWNKASDRVRAYFGGAQEGVDLTGLGVWVGALASNNATLGANIGTGGNGWYGNLSHYRLYNRELTAAEVATLADDGDQVMWVGWIKQINPDYKPSGAYTGKTLAAIQCEGMKHLLDSITVDLSIYEDTTGDEVIADVLASAGLPPVLGGGWRLGIAGSSEIGETTFLADIEAYLDAEVGITVFPLLADGEQESNGMAAIKLVTEGERGHFFVNREGKVVWWNRHHLLTETTSLATVNNTGDYKPVNVDYEFTNRTIANVIRAKAHPRSTVAGATLWTLSTPITVPPETTIEFEVALRDADGKFVGSASVAASGATYSSGTATITVTTLGNRARLSIENASTTIAAVLTALNLVGDGLQDRNTIEAVVEDQASINAYQRREFALNLRALSTFAQVETVARFELARRKDARANLSYMDFLNQADDAANAHQLDWEMGTRVTLALSNGHEADHFIMGEQHNVHFPGENSIHKTRFFLEPAGNTEYWVLGVSTLGETTTLAY